MGGLVTVLVDLPRVILLVVRSIRSAEHFRLWQ